jgi:hypothetical protein
MIESTWTLYVYPSKTRIGTIAQNNNAVVPLSAFPPESLNNPSGTPKIPLWYEFPVLAVDPTEVGNKETKERGAGLLVRGGEFRFGGTFMIPDLDMNITAEEQLYFDICKLCNYQYVYVWFNNYPKAGRLLPTPSTNALRVVLERNEDDPNGNIRSQNILWRKVSKEVL